MELLVSEFDDIGVICGSHEALDEVEKWHGVSFGEGQNAQDIGKEKLVTSISWSEMQLEGSLLVQWAPPSLVMLDLHHNRLRANPTKGHLSVVGWTSTPVLGEAKNLFKPLVVFLSWRRPY